MVAGDDNAGKGKEELCQQASWNCRYATICFVLLRLDRVLLLGTRYAQKVSWPAHDKDTSTGRTIARLNPREVQRKKTMANGARPHTTKLWQWNFKNETGVIFVDSGSSNWNEAIMQSELVDQKPIPKTKGERTRARLLDAAKSVLEREGYHDLKTTDVTSEAELSNGTFYIYFRDKADLVLTLFDEVIEDNIAHIFEGESEPDPFKAVLAANRRYVDLFATGQGLNRAIGQIVDSLPQARLRWQAANARIAKRIAKGIARHDGERQSDDWYEFAAFSLQALLDSILMQIFAYEDPALTGMAKDPDKLARRLSLLWFRAAYGCDPANADMEID